jgi:predicted small secreted protein
MKFGFLVVFTVLSAAPAPAFSYLPSHVSSTATLPSSSNGGPAEGIDVAFPFHYFGDDHGAAMQFPVNRFTSEDERGLEDLVSFLKSSSESSPSTTDSDDSSTPKNPVVGVIPASSSQAPRSMGVSKNVARALTYLDSVMGSRSSVSDANIDVSVGAITLSPASSTLTTDMVCLSSLSGAVLSVKDDISTPSSDTTFAATTTDVVDSVKKKYDMAPDFRWAAASVRSSTGRITYTDGLPLSTPATGAGMQTNPNALPTVLDKPRYQNFYERKGEAFDIKADFPRAACSTMSGLGTIVDSSGISTRDTDPQIEYPKPLPTVMDKPRYQNFYERQGETFDIQPDFPRAACSTMSGVGVIVDSSGIPTRETGTQVERHPKPLPTVLDKPRYQNFYERKGQAFDIQPDFPRTACSTMSGIGVIVDSSGIPTRDSDTHLDYPKSRSTELSKPRYQHFYERKGETFNITPDFPWAACSTMSGIGVIVDSSGIPARRTTVQKYVKTLSTVLPKPRYQQFYNPPQGQKLDISPDFRWALFDE